MKFPVLAALALVVFSTGCTTPSPATKPKAADDEWVTLPPATGSNVPRRVRRSEIESAGTTSNVQTMGADALQNSMHPVNQTAIGGAK